KLAKVAVFATGDLVLKAKEANADLVIGKEDLEKLATEKRSAKELAKNYDFFIAQPDLMPIIGRYLGRYLGPRGKMPKPVPPTADISAILARYRKSIRVRIKDQPQVMCRVGVETQDSKQIAENIEAVLEALKNKFKIPQNIERIYVKLTMGPAVEVKMK
ncbi:MAG: 50S ribosomal protein L1, partial [Thermoprotei archaeon]